SDAANRLSIRSLTRRHALLQYASPICFETLIVFLTQIRVLSLLKLALSRRDQVNQTFSFFHVHDTTKQAARPRPDSKNDQLAASFSLWWSKSTLHKFLKPSDYVALNLSGDNYLEWVMNTSVALKSRGLGKCIIDGNNANESEKHRAITIM
ncbi:unnamed protein product, partial [Brassica oleracea]